MDFSFSEEQVAVRALAHQIFSDACEHEHLAALERDADGDGIDRKLLSALAEANLLGVAVPEEQSGSDFGLGALLVLLEEAGRSVAPVPLLPLLVQAALPLARFGTEAQRDRWLPGIVAGEHLLTVGIEELGARDPARPGTSARPDGDGWLLDGEKVCVPIAASAARVLVPAATPDGGVGVFLVDPSASGVTLEAAVASDHGRQFRMTLSGVSVPGDDLLGDPATGAEILRFIVDHGRVGVAALQIGVAEEALRRTAEYTGTRKQFGREIGTFQAVTMRCADAFIDIESMRSTLWQAAWRLEEGLPAHSEVAAAAWWACRGGHRVVHTTQHLHGGIGADVDYPIHRYFLWANQLAVTAGGAGRQLATIGGALATD